MDASTKTIQRVFDWSDRTAVARSADIAALAISQGRTQLPQLQVVRTAAAELTSALDQEMRAEARDRAAEARAVQAQADLLAAFRPRLEEASMASLRGRLQPALAAWADPYATDATGRAELAVVRRQLADASADLACGAAALHRVVDAMEAAGADRDHAHRRRLDAIAVRLEVRRRWNVAVDALLADLDDGVVGGWLSGLDDQPAAGFAEDDWFEEDA